MKTVQEIWYGWGRVLDYIGIGWENVPEQAVQMHIDNLMRDVK